MIYRTWSSRYK